MDAVADGPVLASGTAGHFRIKDISGQTVYQGKATMAGRGGEMEFDNPTLVGGGVAAISRMPA
jgi:hypothetical protein